MADQSNKERIPYFSIDRILPPGDYHLTIEQLIESFLVSPSRKYPTFDNSWRLTLINNLKILARQLWEAGINDIYIDGSFVEEKDHPNDIDGYFIVNLKDFASGKIQKELNNIDQYQVWD